jgi:hypothetical protein
VARERGSDVREREKNREVVSTCLTFRVQSLRVSDLVVWGRERARNVREREKNKREAVVST